MYFDVDRCFCISLNERKDRQELLKDNLNVLQNKFDFWLVEKDEENPERGCYNSHRDIALYGLEYNLDHILVFEDDIFFHRLPTNKEMIRYNNFIKESNGELFYLGGLLGNMWMIKKFNIVGCNMFCTHSYIMNKKAMIKLAGTPYSGMPIDVSFFNYYNSYATFPMLTSQLSSSVSKSSIFSFSKRDSIFDDRLWKKNRRSQYKSLIMNLNVGFPFKK